MDWHDVRSGTDNFVRYPSDHLARRFVFDWHVGQDHDTWDADGYRVRINRIAGYDR